MFSKNSGLHLIIPYIILVRKSPPQKKKKKKKLKLKFF